KNQIRGVTGGDGDFSPAETETRRDGDENLERKQESAQGAGGRGTGICGRDLLRGGSGPTTMFPRRDLRAGSVVVALVLLLGGAMPTAGLTPKTSEQLEQARATCTRLLLAEAAGGTERGAAAGHALNAGAPTAAQTAQARIEQATAGSDRESEWGGLGCDFWTSRDASGRETGAYPYRYLGYAELVLRMRALAHLYPALVSLKNAQDDLGVAHAGECSEDVVGVEKAGCRVWYLEVGAHRDDGTIPQV
ncbi:hypothetical protein T484DRAFT_2951521, partial [Baffinella frigidus]